MGTSPTTSIKWAIHVVVLCLILVGCARQMPLPVTQVALPPAGPSPTALPTIPTLTPSVTPTATASPLPTSTSTLVPLPTMAPLHVPTRRATATLSASLGPSGTPTLTFTPSRTPTPTHTPTPTPIPVDPPPMITRQEWGAVVPYGRYRSHIPQRITLHEDGVLLRDGDDAMQRVQAIQQFAVQSRGWVDTPYHFFIDRKGLIYEGRPVEYAGDTATNYNPAGHISITLLGDYGVQEVTPAQVDSLVALATWLSLAYNIPPEMIGGHRDYAATSCPGDKVYEPYLASGLLVEWVRQRLQMILAGLP